MAYGASSGSLEDLSGWRGLPEPRWESALQIPVIGIALTSNSACDCRADLPTIPRPSFEAPTTNLRAVEIACVTPSRTTDVAKRHRVDGIDSFGFLVVSVLEGQGFKAATLPYANEGVNIPGLSLIASDDTIKNTPDLVRRMVTAMNASITAARNDPEGAIDSLMRRSPTLNRPVALRTLTLSFDLLDPDWGKGEPLGWMSPKVISKSQHILMQYGGVQRMLPANDYFTNDFVRPN